jgi:hypothetical protein
MVNEEKSNYLFTIGCKFQKEIGNLDRIRQITFSHSFNWKKYLTIIWRDRDQYNEKFIVNSSFNMNTRKLIYSSPSLSEQFSLQKFRSDKYNILKIDYTAKNGIQFSLVIFGLSLQFFWWNVTTSENRGYRYSSIFHGWQNSTL